MRLNQAVIVLLLTAGLLAPAAALAGCAGDELVYDSYGHRYYRWTPGEEGSYREWETRTRRSHLDFQWRNPGDQRAYWDWRRTGASIGHRRH
jgi:hypothetical protein